MAQVRIHRRQPVSDPADPEGLAPALLVTYSTERHSPRDVIVSGETPTEAQIAEAIRQDLQELDQVRPTTLEV